MKRIFAGRGLFRFIEKSMRIGRWIHIGFTNVRRNVPAWFAALLGTE